MIVFWELIKGLVSKNGLLVALIGGLLAMVFTWDNARMARVEQGTLNKVNNAAGQLNAKALEARRGTDRPGAYERLLKHYCRDC